MHGFLCMYVCYMYGWIDVDGRQEVKTIMVQAQQIYAVRT